jgi:hypothetical protein
VSYPVAVICRLLVAAALVAGLASRAPAETLVMVSPPAELDAAVRTSLAPWRVKIIAIEMASGTPAELALTLGAGYVVWRDHDQLVLWNAAGSTAERRDIPPGLDDAGAAALALSIKTWMNLGAPPPPEDVNDPDPGTGTGRGTGTGTTVTTVTPPPPLAAPEWPRLRLDAAAGIRANTGGHGRTEMRLALAAAVRVGPVDAVLGVELGPAHPASAENGTGELSTVVTSAHARFPVMLSPRLIVAPSAGVVLARGGFSGVDTMDRAFTSSAFSVGADVAGLVEYRRGRFLAGVELGATGVPSSVDYQDRNVKMVTPAHIETRGLARIGLVLR